MEGYEKAEERIAQEIGKITGLDLRTCDCYTIAKAVMRIELFSFSDNLKNAGVIARLEATEKDRENLERTLEEINETLRANGISIDLDGNVHYSRRTIITLCGSTKFKAEFEAKNRELTLAGNIVISVACFGHSGDSFTDEQKVLLDEIHKRKIDLADAIYVINKGGYIGESTLSEIKYAEAHGKKVIYMEVKR